MQRRVDMRAGVFVDRKLQQVEPVIGEVERLFPGYARRPEIGGKRLVINMGHVHHAAMTIGQGCGASCSDANGCRCGRRCRRFEKVAPRQHPVLDRVHYTDVTHGFVLPS